MARAEAFGKWLRRGDRTMMPDRGAGQPSLKWVVHSSSEGKGQVA